MGSRGCCRHQQPRRERTGPHQRASASQAAMKREPAPTSFQSRFRIIRSQRKRAHRPKLRSDTCLCRCAQSSDNRLARATSGSETLLRTCCSGVAPKHIEYLARLVRLPMRAAPYQPARLYIEAICEFIGGIGSNCAGPNTLSSGPDYLHLSEFGLDLQSGT
jgi:hypothetical protein